MGIEEFNWQVAYQLGQDGEYENFKVVQWIGPNEWEVFEDTLTNRFWSCPGDYWSSEYLVEVFPTEITKIVYLPKELT